MAFSAIISHLIGVALFSIHVQNEGDFINNASVTLSPANFSASVTFLMAVSFLLNHVQIKIS